MTRSFAEENSMNIAVEKFDNLDRRVVIGAVQKHYDVKLERVEGRDKWRRDESGRNWWVLGGKGDWHGIPKEMMEDEIQARFDGTLIIAQKKRNFVEAFSGSLHPLVYVRDKLYRASRSTGDYQFKVKVSGDRLLCVQAQDVVLQRFETIPYAIEDRDRDKRMNELHKLLATISPKERARLLQTLQGSRNENENG